MLNFRGSVFYPYQLSVGLLKTGSLVTLIGTSVLIAEPSIANSHDRLDQRDQRIADQDSASKQPSDREADVFGGQQGSSPSASRMQLPNFVPPHPVASSLGLNAPQAARSPQPLSADVEATHYAQAFPPIAAENGASVGQSPLPSAPVLPPCLPGYCDSRPGQAVSQLPTSPAPGYMPSGYPGYPPSVPTTGYPALGYSPYPVPSAGYVPGYVPAAYPPSLPPAPGYPQAPYPAYPYPAAPMPGYAQTPYPAYPQAPLVPGYPPSAYPGYPGYPLPTTPAPGYSAPGYSAPYPASNGQPALPAVTPQPTPNWGASQPNYNLVTTPLPALGYPAPGYPAYPYPYPGGQPVAPMPNWQAPNAIPPSNPIYPNVQPGQPFAPPTSPVLSPTAPGLPQPSLTPETVVQEPEPAPRSLFGRSTALGRPSLQLQGVYVYQGDESSARARLSGTYPLTPRILFGTTLDLTTGDSFTDSQQEGLSLNELYVATSLEDLPNLRFVVGQLDLTSYFDRNSFAKDGATHFFNPVFQTNPALSATGIGSRPGALVNWALTDNLEAKAAVFSSSRSISDFAFDGFAGEIGLRYGNAIIRGTYTTGRDAGAGDGFREIFQVSRDGGATTGPLADDREEAFGINGEVFIPSLNMGLFGRYGQYNNRDLDQQGDTYSLGLTVLDVFAPDDRLGLAYGRQLSNRTLRRQQDDRNPDVLELFYDFRFLPNLRLGFTIQELNNFSEIIAGFRVKTEFDVTPRGRLAQ